MLLIPTSLLEIETVSEEEQIMWKTVSDALIKKGKVKRLSKEQYEQAVKTIAEEIVSISIHGLSKGWSEEEAMAHNTVRVNDIQKLINVTAFGAGLHPGYVNCAIDHWMSKEIVEIEIIAGNFKK